MTWNWQQSDWPRFSWNKAVLARAEEHFQMGVGVFVGAVKHLGPDDIEQLTVEAMSTEAITTSEIEGEILNRASVQSSIRKQLGLAPNNKGPNKGARPAEQGIAEMMVDLYRSAAEALTEDKLFAWHRMVMRGRKDLVDVGRYRTSREPMQVVSGRVFAPQVHFEAPPSSDVPHQMAAFLNWFNQSAPGGAHPLPPLARAGAAHLYFVCIHPFEDGNGRIGRAIAEQALAQRLDQPPVNALAAAILARRKQYYAALEAANKSNEITTWLRWFAAIALEAQQRTIGQVEFLIAKTKLLDRLRGQLNTRQQKSLFRMLREGPEGFQGGLSAGKYVTITGASPATATRDLVDMVSKGALLRDGENRHARYRLAIPPKPISLVAIDARGELVNVPKGRR